MCLVYALTFAWVTRPVLVNPAMRFVTDSDDPGRVGDSAMFVWNITSFVVGYRADHNPFHTTSILHPFGADLILHTYTPVLGLLGLVGFSPILAINLGLFLNSVASGLGAYLLARRLGLGPIYAAIASWLFAFCPFRIARLVAHENLELTGAIPFFVLFTMMLGPDLREAPSSMRSRSFAVVGVIGAFVLTLISDYFLTYALLWFVALYLASIWARRVDWPSRVSVRHIVPVVVTAIGISTAIAVVCSKRLGLTDRTALHYSADLVAWLVPSSWSQFWSWFGVLRLRQALHINELEEDIYLGLLVIVPCVLAAFRRQVSLKKAGGSVLVVCIGFFVLASSALRIGGLRLLVLPTGLVHFIPFVNHFRCPSRFGLMLMLFLPMLALAEIETFVSRYAPHRRRVAFALITVIAWLDFMPRRMPSVAANQTPRVYQALAAMPDGALLTIPFGLRDGYRMIGNEQTSAMFFQTIHHKPIVGGMLARIPDTVFNAYLALPGIGDLLRLQDATPDHLQSTPLTSEELARLNIRYLLVTPEMRGKQEEKYLDFLLSGARREERIIDGFRLITIDGAGPSPAI